MIEPETKATELSTREKILAAALDLFAQQGFSATSIRQIAQQVGVRESSIYNHFRSKDEILRTVLSSYGFGFVKTILEKDYLNRTIKDPYQFLNAIVDDIMNRWQEEEDSKFVQVLFMEMFREASARKAYNRDLDASRTFFMQLFGKMQDEGMIKPFDPWLLANEFIGIIVAIHLEYLNRIKEGLDVTSIYHELRYEHVKFFWGAIKLDHQ